MLISETAPLRQNGTLKFVSPCAYMTAVHLWLHTRLREVWTHPHSFAWFDTVEASFSDELWYSNLRVTRGTFTYILREIGDEISRQDTPMRKAKSYSDNVMTKFMINNRTDAWKTDANLLNVASLFQTHIWRFFYAIFQHIWRPEESFSTPAPSVS